MTKHRTHKARVSAGRRQIRVIPIPREEPDTKLLAQALLELVRIQREKEEARTTNPTPTKTQQG